MSTTADWARAIDLTPEEAKLFGLLRFDPRRDHDALRTSCAAASELARSLLARKAIPAIRLRYFTDPEFNIGSRKSRKEVFELNGTRGDDILSHGNFLPYLRYFVEGPALPHHVADAFRAQVQTMGYVSGSDIDTLKRFARDAVRSHRLAAASAAEEFFKLAIECDIEVYIARMVRDAVRGVR